MKQIQKTLLMSCFMIALLSAAVFAIPGQPHQFWGSVTINGGAAPDGTAITAQISGSTVASTTTAGGKYGQSPAGIFYVTDTDPPTRQGKTITFFVNGVSAGTFIFSNGGTTQLDLGVTISQPASPPPSGGGSGGGGGGGGGGGAPSSGSSSASSSGSSSGTGGACVEQWLCNDWSTCVNGIQTRTCTDTNSCGTDDNKPIESQPCTTVTQETNSQPENPSGPSITAFVTGNPSIWGLIAVIILAILYLLWRSRRKGKRFKSVSKPKPPTTKKSVREIKPSKKIKVKVK